MRIRAKRAGMPVAAGMDAHPPLLSEQAGCGRLHVDCAGAAELLHGFHLRAGDVHVIAAIHDALGQKQVRIAGNERLGNFALVQRAQQLLGSDYSSLDVGKSFMHKYILPFKCVLCA